MPFVSKGKPVCSWLKCGTLYGGVSLEQQQFTQEVIPGNFVKGGNIPREISRCGYAARTGDEIHGRGDGVGSTSGKLMPSDGRRRRSAAQNRQTLLSVRDADKKRVVEVARELRRNEFELVATGAPVTLSAGELHAPAQTRLPRVAHIVDMIKNDEFDLIINTTDGKKAIEDSAEIRRAALRHKVSYTTTMSGGGRSVWR